MATENTHEDATRDHDATLKAFLERCETHGLKLNIDKLELRQTEVPFIGHVATGEGIRVDPAKVKAIRDMPTPTDKAGVQQLLWVSTIPEQVPTKLIGHDKTP